MVRTIVASLLAATFIMMTGCSGGGVVTNPSVEERFALAKATFEKGDYLDAINEFTVITLQYQGSQFASDAQFYMAECRFNRSEYLLAAFEYGVLKRSYPASPRVPEAQYRLALSYYRLSPKSALDQQYTRKAIDEFQSFVEYYPSNPLAADADAKIKELNGRLAKKLYDAARQYVTLERYKAAIYYFEDVIEKYHDSDYAQLAYLDKVELFIERKRYLDAQTELTRYLSRYPSSVLRGRADALQERITKEWKRPTIGKGEGTALLPLDAPPRRVD